MGIWVEIAKERRCGEVLVVTEFTTGYSFGSLRTTHGNGKEFRCLSVCIRSGGLLGEVRRQRYDT